MENFEIKKIYSLHIYAAEKQRWSANSPRQGCYFSYQISGKYKHIFKNKELTASAGTVLFINNKDSYSVIEKEKGKAICAVIEIENAPESFSFDTGNDKSFTKLFNSLLLYSDVLVKSNYYIAIGILYELFGKVLKEKEKRNISCLSNLIVEKTYGYIRKNFANPELNMKELSALTDTEIHKLNNMFKEKYGIPCWQYVMSVRFDTACNLLKATDYSVSDIAQMCGFSDPYYFSKAFKKAIGKTPLEFRKNKIKVIKD